MKNILSLWDKFDVLWDREIEGFIVHFKIVSKYKSKLYIFLLFCLHCFQNHLLGTYYIPGTLEIPVHVISTFFLPLNPKYSLCKESPMQVYTSPKLDKGNYSGI